MTEAAIQADAPSTPTRHRHWEMLLICSAAVVLSFLLTIRADGRVAPRGLERFPVPETCLLHSMFGIDCPACGLTRSFISLARGDLHGSLHFHRLGLMMALAVLMQIPYRIACLATGRALPARYSAIVGYAIIAALLLNWAARQF